MVPLHCAVQDGASICFDLAHVVKIEGFRGLDYQFPTAVFLNIESIALVKIGEQLVFWMLRDVVFITEKRSHASELQNTLAAIHDGDLVLRHKLLAGLLVIQAIGVVGGTGF